jgi:ankyrin repeat protein
VCGVCEQYGNTALLLACDNGHLEVAQWLVSSAGSNAVSERNDVRSVPLVALHVVGLVIAVPVRLAMVAEGLQRTSRCL